MVAAHVEALHGGRSVGVVKWEKWFLCPLKEADGAGSHGKVYQS